MAAHPGSQPPPTTWRARIKGFLSGGLLIAIGYWLTSHGVEVFIGRYRQPVFSYSAIAMGVVVIVVSAAPAWLIIKMTALKKYRPYQPGSHSSGDSVNGVATKASFEKQKP
jgi:hypothetical protein